MPAWTSPPTRREFTLLLFCFAVYIISYNIDSSLRLLGVDPGEKGVVLGLTETKHIGNDGRKPKGWNDAAEDLIYGTWAWDEGHVAGDGSERSQGKGSGRYGAMWMSKSDIAALSSKAGLGDTTVNQAVYWWQNGLPTTKVVKNVPGYTILGNVIIFNYTTYIVTDDPSFPNLTSIVAAPSTKGNRWQVVKVEEGRSILGAFGGVVRDVTWMSTDQTPHNSTLFALWRTYSWLDQAIDPVGRTTLPAPVRLVFPSINFFTDANPPFDQTLIRRRRADTGFHPYLAKAAFPRLDVLYSEDWEDYHKMEVPFVIERLIVADRTASQKSLEPNEPIFTPSMNLDASPNWWEPIRRTLTTYLDLGEDSASKHVVTYLHTQGDTKGSQLRDEDHDRLVRSLESLASDNSYEFNVVSTSTAETKWDTKMSAIARSTIVLGVYGDHLFDSMFMKRSPESTLMELFPDATFVRDRELAARSIGLQYIALAGDRKYTSDTLPPTLPPNTASSLVVNIDAEAIIGAVQAALSKS
ncbi:hypothetical protein JOM56_000419 [Amanita muscaria]